MLISGGNMLFRKGEGFSFIRKELIKEGQYIFTKKKSPPE